MKKKNKSSPHKELSNIKKNPYIFKQDFYHYALLKHTQFCVIYYIFHANDMSLLHAVMILIFGEKLIL